MQGKDGISADKPDRVAAAAREEIHLRVGLPDVLLEGERGRGDRHLRQPPPTAAVDAEFSIGCALASAVGVVRAVFWFAVAACV